MGEIPTPHEKRPDFMSILGKLDEVSPEDIEALRSIVKPEFQDTFEDMPERQRLILAFLHKIPENELYALAEISREKRHLPGIHEMENEVLVLCWKTNEDKFQKAFRIFHPEQ